MGFSRNKRGPYQGGVLTVETPARRSFAEDLTVTDYKGKALRCLEGFLIPSLSVSAARRA